MSDDPRHSLGRLGERLAAEHLERLGYRVIARNYRTRFGELDLVVCDDEVLVFCEVKTRRARAIRGRTSATPSGARCGAWGARGSARRATGRGAPSCASTRSASSIDRDGALVRLDHLEGAF